MNPEMQGEKLRFDEAQTMGQVEELATTMKRWYDHKDSDSVTFQEMREGDFMRSTEMFRDLITELPKHGRYIELEVGQRSLPQYKIQTLHGVSPNEIVGLSEREVGPRARIPLTHFESLYPHSRFGKQHTYVGKDRDYIFRFYDVARTLTEGGELKIARELTEQQQRAVSIANEVSIALSGWHNSKNSSYLGIDEARRLELGSARRMLESLIERDWKEGYQLVLKVGENPVATHYIDRGAYESRSIRSGENAEPESEIKISRIEEQARRYEEQVTWFAGSFDLVQFSDLAKAIAEGSKLEVRFDD